MSSCEITYPTVSTIFPFFQLAEQISDNGLAIWNDKFFMLYYGDQALTSYCEYKINNTPTAPLKIVKNGSCGVSFSSVKKILQSFPSMGTLVITYQENEITFACKHKESYFNLKLKALFLDVNQLEVDTSTYIIKANINSDVLQDMIAPLVFYGGDIKIRISATDSKVYFTCTGDQGDGETHADAMVTSCKGNTKESSYGVSLMKKLIDGLSKNHKMITLQMYQEECVSLHVSSYYATTYIMVASKIELKE
jgi:hypothetical protein